MCPGVPVAIWECPEQLSENRDICRSSWLDVCVAGGGGSREKCQEEQRGIRENGGHQVAGESDQGPGSSGSCPGSTCPKSSPTPTPVSRKDAGLLPSGPLPATKHPPACVWGAKARHGANRVSIRIPARRLSATKPSLFISRTQRRPSICAWMCEGQTMYAAF